MNFFEQEMRRFFEDCDFISDQKYTGRTMLGRLDDELLVKATLGSTHIADHYNAVRIKILNRGDGEVDSETVRFGDVIGKVNQYGEKVDPYIWDGGNQIGWYTPVSDEQKQNISDALTDYVSMYCSQGLSLQ